MSSLDPKGDEPQICNAYKRTLFVERKKKLTTAKVPIISAGQLIKEGIMESSDGFATVLLWAFAVSASTAGSNATLSNIVQRDNVPLRILPLGNSITFGFLSTDGNGFRKRLLDKITTTGTNAQYIGSVRAGNMTDNRNEGHPGAIITEIANFSRVSLVLRPNLILLMAGTNDMNNNLLAGATDRLGALIDMLTTACPDAVILVAQLTPATNAAVEARVEQFNPSIPGLVAARERSGRKIAVVNMTRFVTTADLKDDIHPNDAGYSKMSDAWFEGVQQASLKGWFTPPVDLTRPPQSVAANSPISTIGTSTSVLPLATSTFIATSNSSTVRISTSSRISPIPTNSITVPASNTSFTSAILVVAAGPTSSISLSNSSASSTSSILATATGPTTFSVPLAPTSSANDPNFDVLAPTTAALPVASQSPTNDACLAFNRILSGHPVSMLAFAGVWLSLLGI
ncbi:hypothetical protein VTL71DRAFT_7956 [Oculimacula yallundae]|uniref:SGNH hydrolase-type esterase domain-containing protein n=1 Tax=Oculimacula yallundae TaxID=86028 RepID=A0ABR4CW64_9HELO